MQNYCVCCGKEIPEGRMVCPCCWKANDVDAFLQEEARKRILANRKKEVKKSKRRFIALFNRNYNRRNV